MKSVGEPVAEESYVRRIEFTVQIGALGNRFMFNLTKPLSINVGGVICVAICLCACIELHPATETVIYSRFSGPAARNRSRSPSLFRVYLMWIAPARATVAWDTSLSPLAGQGQFETLSDYIPGKGSNLGRATKT
ncbi:hypothetical protein DBV15_06114 [Temnothorax longispinosus]|uniref:Uncharacterized protein n=1 Tax=Temnothorax longispinosus TaxID=300112 RepID=A0A4S2KD11_9HYME|nr:hypothetical protein DBV15_06114 [Temnothorax longispinosus]